MIRVISEIEFQLCKRVLGNFNEREDVCGAARGGHLADNIVRT